MKEKANICPCCGNSRETMAYSQDPGCSILCNKVLSGEITKDDRIKTINSQDAYLEIIGLKRERKE